MKFLSKWVVVGGFPTILFFISYNILFKKREHQLLKWQKQLQSICWQQHQTTFQVWLHFSLPSDLLSIRRTFAAATAAESLQSCPTLCDPIDGSPPGSPVPGILQARTLEWVAISFPIAWKWKVKVKLLSHVRLYRPYGLQPTRLLHPWDFPGKSTGVGCHCLLRARWH